MDMIRDGVASIEVVPYIAFASFGALSSSMICFEDVSYGSSLIYGSRIIRLQLQNARVVSCRSI